MENENPDPTVPPPPPKNSVDLSLVSAHELANELANRYDVMVIIVKKINVNNKIETITWDRYKGDNNMVAGLALESALKAIYGKLSTAFPVQDF